MNKMLAIAACAVIATCFATNAWGEAPPATTTTPMNTNPAPTVAPEIVVNPPDCKNNQTLTYGQLTVSAGLSSVYGSTTMYARLIADPNGKGFTVDQTTYVPGQPISQIKVLINQDGDRAAWPPFTYSNTLGGNLLVIIDSLVTTFNGVILPEPADITFPYVVTMAVGCPTLSPQTGLGLGGTIPTPILPTTIPDTAVAPPTTTPPPPTTSDGDDFNIPLPAPSLLTIDLSRTGAGNLVAGAKHSAGFRVLINSDPSVGVNIVLAKPGLLRVVRSSLPNYPGPAWHFSPALKGGQLVKNQFTFTVTASSVNKPTKACLTARATAGHSTAYSQPSCFVIVPSTPGAH